MINATPSTPAWQIDAVRAIAVYVIYLVTLSQIAASFAHTRVGFDIPGAQFRGDEFARARLVECRLRIAVNVSPQCNEFVDVRIDDVQSHLSSMS
ncbi:hypothetical protein [Paraburkholderia sp.]|uniref:hypothetical protein n=1 Tax=Paraburkholderia sp. TaxID=1926495 RepID=UPI001C0BC257